jgi:hypothetical protein
VLEPGREDRLVVIQHDGHLAMPLVRYFEKATVVAGDQEVRVPEIDLVYHTPRRGRCGLFQGLDCDPALFLFPTFPDGLTPHYSYVGKPHFRSFEVNRYLSDRPPPVRADDFLEEPPQRNLLVLLVEGGETASSDPA